MTSLGKTARHLKYILRFAFDSFGRFDRECPVCSHKGKFRAFGSPPRFDSRCPTCDLVERQRQMALCITRSRLLNDKDVLHFAPEKPFSHWIRSQNSPKSYVTADLFNPADLVINIEQIALPDASKDVILCSHVLEHVDDSRALAEMFRILRPGGLAMLMIPIVEGWTETYENPTVTTIEQRVLHFGQGDHVRYFGSDFRARVRSAGFELDQFVATEPDVSRYGLLRGETLFLARRPA